MANLWINGVCDRMLAVVIDWRRRWESGAVAADRQFMHKDGRLEDIITKRAVQVSWHPKELENLIRILKTVRPDWEFVTHLEAFYRNSFPQSRLLPGGRRLTEMVTYVSDLDEILTLLSNVKTGRVTGVQVGEELKRGSFWESVQG